MNLFKKILLAMALIVPATHGYLLSAGALSHAAEQLSKATVEYIENFIPKTFEETTKIALKKAVTLSETELERISTNVLEQAQKDINNTIMPLITTNLPAMADDIQYSLEGLVKEQLEVVRSMRDFYAITKDKQKVLLTATLPNLSMTEIDQKAGYAADQKLQQVEAKIKKILTTSDETVRNDLIQDLANFTSDTENERYSIGSMSSEVMNLYNSIRLLKNDYDNLLNTIKSVLPPSVFQQFLEMLKHLLGLLG